MEAVSKVLGRFARLADGSSTPYARFGFMAKHLHQRQAGKSAEVVGVGRGWGGNVRTDSLEQKWVVHDGAGVRLSITRDASELASGVGCGIKPQGGRRIAVVKLIGLVEWDVVLRLQD